MRSFDRTMPEELNRVLTDHASSLLLCSSEAGGAQPARERVAGRIEVVGDVMVDIALLLGPSAADRTEILDTYGVTAGEFVLVTAHRAGNVDDPARLERLVELIEALPLPVVFPVHPRTRARLEAAGLLDRLPLSPAARLPRVHGAATARARGADRLGRRQKEAYLAGTPVHHAPLHHRVDRDDRGRLERAGRPRRRRRARRAGARAAGRAAAALRRRAGGRSASWPRLGCKGDDPTGRRGPRLLGPEPGAQLRCPPGLRADLVLRRLRGGARALLRVRSRARASPDELEDLLADEELDAIVLATPVPATPRSPSACCAAGKHCFVEKPLAQSVADAERAVAAAEESGRTLMVGHLLEYHPGVAKLKEIADSGELGDIHYIYSNRLNLGKLRADENALWSLGAHDVSVVLHLADEEPSELDARGESYTQPGIEDVVFGYLRFPSGPRRAPAPVVARPAQGAALHGRRLEADGDLRRHGPRAQGHHLRQGLRRGHRLLRRVHHPRRGTSGARRSRTASRCGSSASTSSSASAKAGSRSSDGASGLRVVRVLEGLQGRLDATRREQSAAI
jgi:predicted dehydrogenase